MSTRLCRICGWSCAGVCTLAHSISLSAAPIPPFTPTNTMKTYLEKAKEWMASTDRPIDEVIAFATFLDNATPTPSKESWKCRCGRPIAEPYSSIVCSEYPNCHKPKECCAACLPTSLTEMPCLSCPCHEEKKSKIINSFCCKECHSFNEFSAQLFPCINHDCPCHVDLITKASEKVCEPKSDTSDEAPLWAKREEPVESDYVPTEKEIRQALKGVVGITGDAKPIPTPTGKRECMKCHKRQEHWMVCEDCQSTPTSHPKPDTLVENPTDKHMRYYRIVKEWFEREDIDLGVMKDHYLGHFAVLLREEVDKAKPTPTSQSTTKEVEEIDWQTIPLPDSPSQEASEKAVRTFNRNLISIGKLLERAINRINNITK